MLTLGSLAFASPWLLAALAVLPVIWLLLRVTPPAPRRLAFPAIRILHLLTPKEETPARTPWWLVLLRLAIAALVILGLAEPLLNPAARLAGDGPVVIAIDDTWAAAPRWDDRRKLLLRLVEEADHQNRTVVLLTTSEGNDEARRSSGVLRPLDARAIAQALDPQPWGADLAASLAALDKLQLPSAAATAYLADGLDRGADQVALIERLQRLGRLTVYASPVPQLARALLPPDGLASDLVVTARRPVAGAEAEAGIRAIAGDGRLLAREPARFAADGLKTEVKFVLPTELRNQVQRLEIENEASAAAVVLLDERWRRRPVGLVGPTQFDASQPLLDELHYLDKALVPFAEVRRGPVADLLKRELAVILMPDSGALPPAERAQLTPWIEAGGVLMRFAGPKLANADDDLVPVKLRKGDRALGGALSWGRPQPLAAFDATSPFSGLAVPAEVTVQRQVLAQPGLELAERTWARLTDGTPLVTAEKRGDGWMVLVHTTANAAWTNLPISGIFVEMLQRLIGLSQGVAGGVTRTPLPPVETLDGFGRLRQPPATALAIPGGEADTAQVNPRHPPGYYGSESVRRALNLAHTLPDPKAIGSLPAGVSDQAYGGQRETDFKPWLLLAALLLAAMDLLASLWLRRLLWMRPAATAGIALAFAGALFAAAPAGAQTSSSFGSPDAFSKAASLQTRLAYVLTGDGLVDQISYAGLRGLSSVVNRRTAAELGDPVGVSPAIDDLSFFPVIYWPLTEAQALLTEQAVARLNGFMRNGGTILFDTRERGNPALANLLPRLGASLDIPKLMQMPADHVMTRAYYLLREMPGRYAGGSLWVERTGERINDGVSSVIVGGNDWAAAWAVDDSNRPLYSVEPGGERQREIAYRFGINLVMYTLTGNYKADQIHVPEILKRLDR